MTSPSALGIRCPSCEFNMDAHRRLPLLVRCLNRRCSMFDRWYRVAASGRMFPIKTSADYATENAAR